MVAITSCKDKTVGVMGVGHSGLAAAQALKEGGATVVVWDDREASRHAAIKQGLTVKDLTISDNQKGLSALVLSPGIPFRHPIPHPAVTAADIAGVPIIGEASLLAKTCPDAHYIGVTGTNGKSTTTALIGHILEESGKKVAVGGNLGKAACSLPPLGKGAFYVLEMSSYQLDLSPVQFNTAILLNVTPDHLDRHGGLEGYITAKKKIFAQQQTAATAILGVDDNFTADIKEDLASSSDLHVFPISGKEPVRGGVGVDKGWLLDDRKGGGEKILDLTTVPALPGSHNAQNIAAAWATAKDLNILTETVRKAIQNFPGLPHRQERVAVINGISFVNDSKATNPDATAKALACYDTLYWIVGGREKEGGYDDLVPLLQNRVRHAFLIGEGANNIATVLSRWVPCALSGDLATAVRQAYEQAKREKTNSPVVLLSPACSSHDQFENFEARGEAFRVLVNELWGEGT